MLLQKRFYFLLIWILFIGFLIISCKPVKNINYAEPYLDSQKVNLQLKDIPVNTIQPFDVVSIAFYGKSNEVASLFNNFGGTPGGSVNSDVAKAGNVTGNNLQEYSVSADGYIELPMIKRIKVSGMTVNQLREVLTEKVKDYLREPIVLVRLSSFKITIIGEVTNKGVFNVPSQKISIFEAMGLCGDITTNGVKNKVKVIREENGSRTMATIDLTSKEVFNSDFYYLKPNDLVYVPVDQYQKKAQRMNTLLPYFSLGLSSVSILLTVINLLKK